MYETGGNYLRKNQKLVPVERDQWARKAIVINVYRVKKTVKRWSKTEDAFPNLQAGGIVRFQSAQAVKWSNRSLTTEDDEANGNGNAGSFGGTGRRGGEGGRIGCGFESGGP